VPGVQGPSDAAGELGWPAVAGLAGEGLQLALARLGQGIGRGPALQQRGRRAGLITAAGTASETAPAKIRVGAVVG
jgi:hypothetical protein